MLGIGMVPESSVRYRGCVQQLFTIGLLDDDGELVEDDQQILIECVQEASGKSKPSVFT